MWASGTKSSGGGYTSKLKATFFAGTTVNPSTWTKQPFAAVAYDNDSEVDTVTNKRWDVAATGIYRITAACTMKGMSSAIGFGCIVKIYKNGSTFERSPAGKALASSDNYGTALHTTCLELTAGDYIEVYVWHNAIGAIANEGQCNYLAAERIG